MIAAGKMRRRSAMPFGVFLAFGGVLVLFVGPALWSFYLDFAGGA